MTDPRGHGSLDLILDYVERIVRASGLDLDTAVHTERDALVVAMEGPDGPVLLARRGELLEAFQIVLGKVLHRKFGTTLRILVDSSGYRLGREHEIIEIARLSAEKAVRLNQPVELSPMNPHDRRLVHLALRDIDGIATASTGEGLDRRVRIVPKGPAPEPSGG